MIQRFLAQGMIGFFKSATINCVILHDKITGVFENIFTLVTLNETAPYKKNVIRRGSPKPLSLKNKRSVMLTFQDVDLATVVQLYSSVANSGQWQQPGCPPLVLEPLSEIGPVFTPKEARPVGYVLRNSSSHCNYIMEFFAEQKTLYKSMNQNEINQITTWLLSIIPVDLQTVSDRWGNIIFQLPITILDVKERGNSNNGLNVAIAWHPKISTPPDVDVRVYSTFDKAVIGDGTSSGTNNVHTVSLNSNHGLVNTRITRKSDEVLLFQSEAYLMERFIQDIRITHSIKRTVNVPKIRNSDPQISYTVDLYSKNGNHNSSLVDWRYWVGQRQHKESVTELETKKHFVQYARDGVDEHPRALSDIQFLISEHGDSGVYLWDPYCSARDVLVTVFACKRLGAPLRVITSKLAMNDVAEKDWIIEFQDFIKNSGNLEGIDLRVRLQCSQPASLSDVWSTALSRLRNVGHPQCR